MTLLNAVEISFYYTFTREAISDETCGYKQKMYYGLIYCSYYTISMQIGYSLIVLLKQIKDFVDKQELPTEKIRRRNKKIVIVIWLVAFI